MIIAAITPGSDYVAVTDDEKGLAGVKSVNPLCA